MFDIKKFNQATSILLDALRYGNMLPNPTTYKWLGVAASVLALLLIALVSYTEVDLSAVLKTIEAIVTGLVSLSTLLQITTTDKIGVLPPKKQQEQEQEQNNGQ